MSLSDHFLVPFYLIFFRSEQLLFASNSEIFNYPIVVKIWNRNLMLAGYYDNDSDKIHLLARHTRN